MGKRHKKHEEHENHERWLVSYADFITLLFAFFVVLYATGRSDTTKVNQAAEAIRWAMHFSGSGGGNNVPVFGGANAAATYSASVGVQNAQKDVKVLDSLRKRIDRVLRTVLLDQKDSKSVMVTVENGKLTVRLAASNFFDAGGAAIRPDTLAVVDAIASELKPLNRPLRIEGHTDDMPTGSNGRFRNNWDLSASRAAAVVDYFERGHHIEGKLLTAAGLGSTRPLFANDTPEHREMNRRIEIAVDVYPEDDSMTTLSR